MKKIEIFRKIGGIITELNDQHQYLSANPDNLNDLELELFLANSNFLSDHIEILRKLNSVSSPQPQSMPAPVPVAETIVQADAIDQPEERAEAFSVFKFDEDETDAFDYEQKGVDELFDRQLTAEERRIIDSKKETIREPEVLPVAAEPVTEPVQVEEPVSETPAPGVIEQAEEIAVAEPVIVPERPVIKPVTEAQPVAKPTINELISAQVSTSTVASRIGQKPASDLKSMISLNDKLLFVKDLFNGYSLAYSEAIELVNRFDSFEAADNFLKLNYAGKNNWEARSNTVEKFYEILSRRFS